MTTINVTAGKVPGGVQEIGIAATTTILEAVKEAARVDGQKRGLGRPSFEVVVGDYTVKNQNTVDIPQVNGVFYADYNPTCQRWENIRWNTPAQDGDIILVVPKIQGAQFIVSVIMDGWDEPRKVAVFDPGDPEGGIDAGTVAQALSAAGVRVSETDIIVVYDGEESYPAGLDEHLIAGAEVFIYSAGHEFTHVTPATLTEAEVLAVAGVNPTDLRDDAAAMLVKASKKEADVKRLIGQARDLRKAAAAYNAKAEAINLASAAFSAAKARLTNLGVIRVYTRTELEVMSAKALRAILREKGNRPGAMVLKTDLVKWVLSLQ